MVAPGEQHPAPRPAACTWLPLAPWGVLLLLQLQATTRRDFRMSVKAGWEGNDRFLQLISAKQSHFGAEA